MNLKKILSIFFDIFEDKFNKVYSKKNRKSLFENNTMKYFQIEFKPIKIMNFTMKIEKKVISSKIGAQT